jgi:hypothetical protein
VPDQSAPHSILTSSNLFSTIDAEVASMAESLVIIDPDACAPGIPAMAVTAAHAREIVRDNEMRDQLRDAIWAALVRRAMMQPRQWQRVAIWIALPGLRVIVNRLRRVWRPDLDDLRSEVVLGFLEALRQADPDQSHLGSRLWWTTYRLARQMCRQARCEYVAENIDLLTTTERTTSLPAAPSSIRSGSADRLVMEGARLGSLAARLGLRAVVNECSSGAGDGIIFLPRSDAPRSRVLNTRGTGPGDAA